MKRILATLIASATVFYALYAWAQSNATPPVTALTPTSVTITVLAAITAFVVNAFNSGSLFGMKTVPQAWLPYLGVLGPFLTAITLSLTQAGALSGVAIFNAIVAGFYTLIGSAVGAATHTGLKTHFTLHKVTLAARAAAAKTVVTTLTVLTVLVFTLTGCSQSTLQNIENSLKTGLENGTLLANLEQLIISILPQLQGQIATVDTILQGIVTWLLQTGVLTPQGQTNAKAVLVELQAKLAANPMKVSELPSAVSNELRLVVAKRIDPAGASRLQFEGIAR